MTIRKVGKRTQGSTVEPSLNSLQYMQEFSWSLPKVLRKVAGDVDDASCGVSDEEPANAPGLVAYLPHNFQPSGLGESIGCVHAADFQ